MGTLRLGVLASHNGSNLAALHQASLLPDSDFTISVTISNNSSSGALAYARDHGVPTRHLSGHTHPDTKALDNAMRATLVEHGVDLVVTAGFMRKLGPIVRETFSSRIINIHPALLPAFGGVGFFGNRVHQAVLDSGDKISGPTVHLVDDEYDTGEIIAQSEVPVLPDDTVDTLAARVLAAEHILLPTVVRQLASGHQLHRNKN
ncbi:phosphoribosylglycinamide formyltransferase [Nocardia sp. NBC_01388]|uniref:phosphoribosylglycinamide formyltransferase n=1 Tax=Nocardia sp. NBC_01388 TaxID=2903596 RepID=UPI0032566AC3